MTTFGCPHVASSSLMTWPSNKNGAPWTSFGSETGWKENAPMFDVSTEIPLGLMFTVSLPSLYTCICIVISTLFANIIGGSRTVQGCPSDVSATRAKIQSRSEPQQ